MSLLSLGTIMVAIWALTLLLVILSTIYSVIRFNNKKQRSVRKAPKEGVSILKPLKGFDPSLEENLRSFFHLKHSSFELLFSVAERNDPAVKIVRKLMSEYPRINARLFLGASYTVPNPKVDNMLKAYNAAENDIVIISDSNIRVTLNYINECLRAFKTNDKDIGVVTAIVRGVKAQGLIGQAETLTLNTFCARGQMIAEIFDQSFVLGKSMAFRKSVAHKFGGLKTIGRYLAEDFMSGESMRLIGKEVSIMSSPVDQVVGRLSLKSFFQRHLRWARLRKAHSKLTLLAEVLLNPIASGLLGSFILSSIASLSFAPLFLTHLLFFFTMDMILHRVVLKAKITELSPLAWCIKEVVGLAVWLTVWTGNSVQWRGKKIAISKGGLIHENPTEDITGALPVGSSH